jgi:transposase
MDENFSFHNFLKQYPDDETCLEEIKKLQYPKGIYCIECGRVTKHYKIKNRHTYACKMCRSQVSPLAGTIFEKSTTPLRIWFYALFLMTQTRAALTIKQLQRELGVTYKTAWRIYSLLYELMKKKNGDLLMDTDDRDQKKSGMNRWTFFYKVEYDEVQKDDE